MTKHRLPTITIGIPAHNEERSIANFLKSLFAQKTVGFVVNDIVVVCDGCFDNTEVIAKELRREYRKLAVINDGKRLGKAGRLNKFYEQCKSDIFVTFDADVQLANNNVLIELVKPFSDPEVALVGGRDIPFQGDTFIEKCLVTYERFWQTTIDQINKGNNVHNHRGPISAVRTSLVRNIRIPENVFADDHFLFFKTVFSGHKFVYAPKAAVYYKLPSTIHDFCHQFSRYDVSKTIIDNYFGAKTADYYKVPVKAKMTSYLRIGIEEPIRLAFAIVLQMILKMYESQTNKMQHKSWESIQSSKV